MNDVRVVDTSKSLSPTDQKSRIGSLDLIRGFALLGILVVNIQGVAMVSASYQNPLAYGSHDGANYWVWWVTHVFFELKMMSIFSMLFGAGIALAADRATAESPASARLHYRRMLWLMVIGLLHAYLIWYGDILFCYSICGMLVYLLRNQAPRVLCLLGLSLFAIPSLINHFFTYAFQHMSPAEIAALNADWQPTAEQIQAELNAYRGNWLEQMPWRAKTAFMMQTFVNLILFFWRAGGLMLIGMGLYKAGFLDGSKSNRTYLTVAIIAGLVGWAFVLLGIKRNEMVNWEVTFSLAAGSQYNYWGSLLVSVTYLCLLIAWFKSEYWQGLQAALRAVGQMALTNYLMQSIAMTFFCWGHGLGWVGELNRLEQMAIVIGIWAFQLIASPIWLGKFRFGPSEWAWRSLSYAKWQPIFR